MLLTPSYDGPPPLAIEGPCDDQHEPLVRQRARLADVLAGLSEAQWAAPSRCEGWSNQDVIAHLIGVNRFWAHSIRAGLAGTPSRLLIGFDPAASPPEMVAPMRSMTTAESLAQLVDSNQAIFDAVADLDDAGWSTLGEAPPGHIPIRLVANHALWDAWVHERDIVLPLGLPAVEEPDEVRSCLRYAAALGPALALSHHPGRTGAFVVDPTDAGPHLVVEVAETVRVHSDDAPEGAARISGTSVELAEAFSVRGPIPAPDLPTESAWLLEGLATIFDAV